MIDNLKKEMTKIEHVREYVKLNEFVHNDKECKFYKEIEGLNFQLKQRSKEILKLKWKDGQFRGKRDRDKWKKSENSECHNECVKH